VRFVPLDCCLKQSACQLSIMLEKQICSGKIIVFFHIEVRIIKTLALYSQKAHHNSVTKQVVLKCIQTQLFIARVMWTERHCVNKMQNLLTLSKWYI
jgi:hypothetical protein